MTLHQIQRWIEARRPNPDPIVEAWLAREASAVATEIAEVAKCKASKAARASAQARMILSPEREIVLRERHAEGVTARGMLAELNALPGRPFLHRTLISTMTRLGLRRPDDYKRQRAATRMAEAFTPERRELLHKLWRGKYTQAEILAALCELPGPRITETRFRLILTEEQLVTPGKRIHRRAVRAVTPSPMVKQQASQTLSPRAEKRLARQAERHRQQQLDAARRDAALKQAQEREAERRRQQQLRESQKEAPRRYVPSALSPAVRALLPVRPQGTDAPSARSAMDRARDLAAAGTDGHAIHSKTGIPLREAFRLVAEAREAKRNAAA